MYTTASDRVTSAAGLYTTAIVGVNNGDGSCNRGSTTEWGGIAGDLRGVGRGNKGDRGETKDYGDRDNTGNRRGAGVASSVSKF